MNCPVPENYLGLWRRTVLEQSGKLDVSSCVIWLQTACWHGDLRIPSARPDFGNIRSLQECTRGQLLWLLRQEGFAGTTRVHGDICEWRRRYDYRPTGTREIGRMVCLGQTIEEYGVDQEYFERWVRVPIAATQHSACQVAGKGGTGVLVRAGEYFMYFRPRSIEPAVATHLWAVIGADRITDGDLRLLADFEISFGVIGASAWRILHSTLPWREGSALSLDGHGRDLNDGLGETGERYV